MVVLGMESRSCSGRTSGRRRRVTLRAMGSAGGLLLRSWQLLHAYPVGVDVAAAAALMGGALWAVTTLPHDKTVPATVVAALVCTSAVGWRRLAPALAATVALSAVVGYQISGQDTQGVFVSIAIVLSCYAVGRLVASRLRVGLVAGYALAAVTGIELDAGFSLGTDMLSWLPLAVAPIVAGLVVARRDTLLRDLGEARSRLQEEQDLVRAGAVVEERARVARELHDVVAHCVSVMVIQAGAARLHAASDVATARAAMRVVAASGRETLADLHSVVGSQRRGEDAFAAAALGFAQLPPLIDGARRAGMPVRLQLDASANVPADVELAAFRIVQEALTNVRKHAPSATADVTMNVTADAVEITVVDSGPARSPAPPGSGNGLVGMRERVALHGGELHASPTAAGGFAVHARLPLAPTAMGQRPSIGSSASARSSRHPSRWQVDALFSLAWLVPLEIEAVTSTHRSGPLALSVILVAAMAVAGVLRRRVPLTFLIAVGGLALALSGGIASPQRPSVVATYALFVGAYTIAAYSGRPRALAGLGALIAGVLAASVAQHTAAGVAFGGALTAALVWLAGRVTRNQRQLVTDLRAATERLAAEHDQHALFAQQRERMRIAGDLHTIVARLVTTMVIQAEAAEAQLTADPRGAVEAIAAIEATGRQALVQLRQILGVLRNGGERAPRQPRLDLASTRPAPGVALAAQP